MPQPTLITAISDEWYGFDLFGTPGDIVTNLSHINQAILTILTTPRQSVPHHPNWFSDLHALVDKPVTTVRSLLAQRVTQAITTHEPRVDVLGVSIAPASADNSRLSVKVRWRVKENAIASETTVTI